MKSLLLLIITFGIIGTFSLFILFFIDSNFQTDPYKCNLCLSQEWTFHRWRCDYLCEIRILWWAILTSLACGVITFFAYKFYKKMKWENDFIHLYIRTRFKRSSRNLKSAKDNMRRELDDE